MIINNSSLQTYLKCGLKYEFEYVKKVERPTTWSLWRGTALHLTRRKNLEQKITSKTDLPLEELRESSLEMVKDAVQSEAFVQEPEIEAANVIDQGLRVDYMDFQRTTQPVVVEQLYKVAPVGYDYSLFGTVDLYDSEQNLRDLKTVGRTPQMADLLRSTQMSTYQLFAMSKGMKVKKIQHDYLVFRKKGVEAVPLEVEPRTKEDLRGLLDTYQQAVTGISAGIFLPAPAGSWWCSPKWCSFWPICPAITKAAKQYYIEQGE